MDANDATSFEDSFSHLLAEADEALDNGFDLAPACNDAPLQARLLQMHQCLRRLHEDRNAMGHRCHTSDGAVESAMSPAEAPTHVGRFRIIRELGRGGHGIVFLAHDPALERPVALKIPRPETLLTSEMRQRFLREARIAAGLAHPNLVPIYDVGEIGPTCYLVEAYQSGQSLAEFLKRRKQAVPVAVAVRFIATLAEAVQYIHERGILHRDIKPANVLLKPFGAKVDNEVIENEAAFDLSAYSPRLSDFGLAKWAADSNHVTHSGTVLGTPAYMSPEQAAWTHECNRPGDGCVRAGGYALRITFGPAALRRGNSAENAAAGPGCAAA